MEEVSGCTRCHGRAEEHPQPHPQRVQVQRDDEISAVIHHVIGRIRRRSPLAKRIAFRSKFAQTSGSAGNDFQTMDGMIVKMVVKVGAGANLKGFRGATVQNTLTKNG